ncbi:MFS transporter [Streptomyces sp. SID10853]|uniref:MFS transporter n=1 Tax=Streptomyces sp. SID10853 TaxID=2706028 RepID=UPI0013BFE508|nr:MFS transporter [Streptomyces sp. SID10853]NDZ79595.1 MFS transporter [Streptomyces sp. SID10853]
MSATQLSTPERTFSTAGPAWPRIAASAMFACGWGGNQFTPLLIMYRRVGGYSVLSVDMFLGAYVVGLIPGLLFAGPLSDRHGRRRVMIAGTALSVLASGILAFGSEGPWPIYAGRLLTGIAVGVAMSVGSSWVKELSTASADPTVGARRASLWLTSGFGLGAGLAGLLAQWGPWPMALPYVVHIVLTLPVLALLPRVPETRAASPGAGRAASPGAGRAASPGAVRGLLRDLRVPADGRRRFRLLVLPMAPWVFGAAGLAYAVMPQLVDDRLGEWGLVYATALTVLYLGAGVAVQPLAKRLDRAPGAVNPAVMAMTVMVAGTALCAVDAVLRSPWLALAAAVVLGAGYGIAVVTGLLEIQRIAGPDDLAGLTGVYYALAYAGFLLPTLLALLSARVPYPALLTGVATLAVGCLSVVVHGMRRPGVR